MADYSKRSRCNGAPKFSGMQARQLVIDSEHLLWQSLNDQAATEEARCGAIELDEELGWILLESEDPYGKLIGATLIRLLYPTITLEAS